MRLFPLILALAEIVSVPATAATLTIQVEANRAKINDAPWDGVAGTGAGKGALFFGVPTSGPPDLAICVSAVDMRRTCLFKGEGKDFHSYCQNSYECDFHGVEVGDVFGIIILDLDTVQLDFVDAAILVTDEASANADLEALEQKVRADLAVLAPALTEGEKQRRERPFQRFDVSQCAGDRECALRQSILRISE